MIGFKYNLFILGYSSNQIIVDIKLIRKIFYLSPWKKSNKPYAKLIFKRLPSNLSHPSILKFKFKYKMKIYKKLQKLNLIVIEI